MDRTGPVLLAHLSLITQISQLSRNNIYANLVVATKRLKSTNAFAKSCVLLMFRRG
jgi:hypothetical protein